MINTPLFRMHLDTLSEAISLLPDKPEETHLNTLKALWLAAAGRPVSVILAEMHELPALSDTEISRLEAMVERRIAGEPLAHISGKQSFMNLEMLAGPEALIPRKETEILATMAIEILADLSVEELCVVDVCTGAGNVALAMAHRIQHARVLAADISADAVGLARRNADFLDLASRVEFHCGDLLEPLEALGLHGRVDLLTCNPPYISTAKVAEMAGEISAFEPDLAFDGGVFGVNLIRRLIGDAAPLLREGGYLVFEVGLGQGNIIRKQVEKSGAYSEIKTVNDGSGNARVIVAKK